MTFIHMALSADCYLYVAVSALPVVLTDMPAATPSPAKEVLAPKRVRALAQKLTGKNWRTVKAELLAVTG